MSTPVYQQARRHLAKSCPVMRRVISEVGPCTFTPNLRDPFTLLVRCVLSQQISTKAAESIFVRLAAAVGGHESIPMGRVARFSDARFRACGVSAPKQRTLRAVIAHVKANPGLLNDIVKRDDDTVRELLTEIKGIGPWSADMYLMFGLGRPDVLPVGDYGFRVALKLQFKLKDLPDAKKSTKLGEPWRPYRSIATWYLWQSLKVKPRGED
jgi:DNA-3-methyladenine glycosylase II